MLLENYLMQIEWIEAEVDDLVDEVRNTEGKFVSYLVLIITLSARKCYTAVRFAT
jgi:hypothetical protein